ncbi:hypothetical protein DNHGIG_32200 [Collibacillus ludicampi]|uniref:Uncharacterized protein n=1 Tax=Collibacillus ludicampi TaxID=2771369 RepID=A0AAV4LIT8_9BACL|nr:hypothetical protein [Collibacillus ludicampi]GIM47671.1 hypothetical protein DNHGIG_32200 [Collibacillus ludicampi]
MKVALCPGGRTDVAQWLADEAKDAGYEIVIWPQDHGDLTTVQALFCFAEQNEGRAASLRTLAQEALVRGLPVIWAVEGEPLPGAFRSYSDFSKLPDATPFLDAVLDLPKPVTEEEQTPKRRLSIPSPAKLIQRVVPQENVSETPPREEETLPSVFNHVIAVGGPRGAGSSFLAWNLAVALDAVLMEGRVTDSLAKWLEVEKEGTREAYLRGELQTKAAVTASQPLSLHELQLLARVQERVVVDVGDALDSEVWLRAGKQVFVMTPDPKCKGGDIPERAIRVMNRYPEAFPIRPEKLVQARIDLIVSDLGREAFLSLCSQMPWVEKPPDVKEQWVRLFVQEKPQEKPEQREEAVSVWSSWS